MRYLVPVLFMLNVIVHAIGIVRGVELQKLHHGGICLGGLPKGKPYLQSVASLFVAGAHARVQLTDVCIACRVSVGGEAAGDDYADCGCCKQVFHGVSWDLGISFRTSISFFTA